MGRPDRGLSPGLGGSGPVVATAASVALLYFLRAVLIPLVVAFVLVVLVDALVRLIARQWPGAPNWAVSIGAGLAVIITAAISIFVLAEGAVKMVARSPAVADRLEQLAQAIGRSLHLSRPLHFNAIVGELSARQVAGFILSGVQGIAPTVVLVIVYFGFMLAGRSRISRKVQSIAGSVNEQHRVSLISERIAANIRTYIWVQALTGAMRTACAAAVMIAVGMNNVPFWVAAIFLLTFIPEIGITIGSIAVALFALVQFPTVWQAVAIFGFIQSCAFIIGNFIYPRMQAKAQNLDPVAIILGLSFWTLLWGLPGAFLAVPMTIMLMLAMAQFEGTYWLAALLSNDGRVEMELQPRP